jgi:hypothetical protein
LYIQAISPNNVTGNLNSGITFGEGWAGIYGYDAGGNGANGLGFFTGANTGVAERLRITNTGLVGIGTSNLTTTFTVYGGNTGLELDTSLGFSNRANTGTIRAYDRAGSAYRDLGLTGANILFGISDTEKARIDSSGRLLVGTSSARSNTYNASVSQAFQVEGTTDSTRGIGVFSSASNGLGGYLTLAMQRSGTIGGNTIVNNADELGFISFQGSDGTQFVEGARISTFVDGTPGANDMPGRLVFSTTADGASSPTERMRITSAGTLLVNTTESFSITSSTATGFSTNVGIGRFYASATTPLYVGRQTDDGTLVDFRQGGSSEGVISVSGSTVTYGGGHLARWSQLSNDDDPSGILKGTVMSNLDEMCEWGDEDNEQLNKTKVSDVEGDPNVAGVFVSTSFDEEGPFDFFVAMTGDMIIRIAEDVTVQRGDLLMSAGDGTAKPQDDDIIRSKTIAKVTSTHVTCTYDDGSYCVPCVLMAC